VGDDIYLASETMAYKKINDEVERLSSSDTPTHTFETLQQCISLSI
jgi:hypothetical protein